jgi:hypothetical protein
MVIRVAPTIGGFARPRAYARAGHHAPGFMPIKDLRALDRLAWNLLSRSEFDEARGTAAASVMNRHAASSEHQ